MKHAHKTSIVNEIDGHVDYFQTQVRGSKNLKNELPGFIVELRAEIK